MKFLCLHGAIGNIDNFGIQLQFLEQQLLASRTASFHFINGPCEVDPPEGFQEYFGAGPHYRWFNDGGSAEESMLTRVRALPAGDTPEDVMRALAGGREPQWLNRTELLQYVYETIDADPEIQGVLGYSEGAALAATIVLDEMIRFQEEGRPRQLKCAVFLTGWPPIFGDGKVLLCDESETIIDVPTLHVLGANDPYKDGALALYNVCDEEKAHLFDTARGHTIPRSEEVLRELNDAVAAMLVASHIE